MNRLYSKTALITKTVFCALLAPLFILISSVVAIGNSFLYIVVSAIPIGCLFTIPFWLTLNYLKKYRVDRIGKYIVYDFIVCIIPAVFGVLCSEIIYTIFNEKTVAAGVITAIFFAIFVVISLLFWLLYFIFSHKK